MKASDIVIVIIVSAIVSTATVYFVGDVILADITSKQLAYFNEKLSAIQRESLQNFTRVIRLIVTRGGVGSITTTTITYPIHSYSIYVFAGDAEIKNTDFFFRAPGLKINGEVYANDIPLGGFKYTYYDMRYKRGDVLLLRADVEASRLEVIHVSISYEGYMSGSYTYNVVINKPSSSVRVYIVPMIENGWLTLDVRALSG